MNWLMHNINNSNAKPSDIARIYKIPKSVIYRKLQKLNKIPKQCLITKEEDVLARKIAAFILRCMSKKKFRSVPTEIAIKELERIKAIPKNSISISRANELMRYLGISKEFFKLASPCIRMKTTGPNMLHQADFTVSQMFYLDNIRVRHHSEYTKREPRRKIMIGAVKDHFSQCIYAQGYEMQAESTEAVIRFLHDGWSDKSSISFPFHGLPWQLYTDAGPGWKSRPAQQLYKSLYITWKPHSPGNPRATGSIEKAIDGLITFEKIMKGRLCTGANLSLADFNRMLFEYCIDLNNKPHTVFTKQKRFEVWQQIKDEDIRQCPPIDVFVKLTATDDEPRKVTPYGTIKYKGKEYFVGTNWVHRFIYPYVDLHKQLYAKIPNYGIVGPLNESIPAVIFGTEFQAPPLTDWEKNIRQVKEVAEQLGFTPDDIEYERRTDEMYVPRAGREVVRGRSDPNKQAEAKSFANIYEAKSYLADTIDFDNLDDEIRCQIDEILDSNTDETGSIPITVVDEIIKIVQTSCHSEQNP